MTLNTEIAITCAVTGAGETPDKNPNVPVTPKEIAQSCIDAANAGAAIVHVHVRDPETGKGARGVELYTEVVERIKDAGTNIIINLTAGMGGNLHVPHESPNLQGPNTDLVTSKERFAHIEALKPEICTIDCGTMNFGEEDIAVNRPRDLVWMAKRAKELGVKPELEVFDLGQIVNAVNLIKAGLIEDPPMFQLCLGIAGGAPATPEAMMALRDMLPHGAHWAAFGISRAEFPMVAQAALLGGHVRVGLEDNLYLAKGIKASNGSLVERAVSILDAIGMTVMSPSNTRKKLGLKKQ